MWDGRKAQTINLCDVSDRDLAKIATKIHAYFTTQTSIQRIFQNIHNHLVTAKRCLAKAEEYHCLLSRHVSKYGVKGTTDIILREMTSEMRVACHDVSARADAIYRFVPSSNTGMDNWLREETKQSLACQGIRDIFQDLQVLLKEFPKVSWLPYDELLIVVTKPVTLQDQNGKDFKLGPMEIRLYLPEVDKRCARAGSIKGYRIEPQDPYWSDDERYFHPNCSGSLLCEGSGAAAITQALQDRRLLDFFTIVDRILHTYGSNSPHRALEDWHAPPCIDCGGPTYEDGRRICEYCGETLCEDCGRWCELCEITVCNEHSSFCDSCEISLCRDCSRVCTICNRGICRDCLIVCNSCGDIACEHCVRECLRCEESFCSECTKDMDEQLCSQCKEEHDNEQETEKEGEEETSTSTRSGERPGFTDTRLGWADSGDNSSSDSAGDNRIHGPENIPGHGSGRFA